MRNSLGKYKSIVQSPNGPSKIMAPCVVVVVVDRALSCTKTISQKTANHAHRDPEEADK